VRHYNENSANTYHPRSPGLITSFFDGLDLAEPGIVELTRWRPRLAGPARYPGWAESDASPDAGAPGRRWMRAG
jgi:hypothetical protein